MKAGICARDDRRRIDWIEHGYEVKDETLALMKQKGIVLVPTDVDDFSLKRYVERQKIRTFAFSFLVSQRLARTFASRNGSGSNDSFGL